MLERDKSRDEQSRRKLIVLVSTGILLISLVCAVPGWLHQPEHSYRDLAFKVIPLASASAFLAGLCVGLPTLCPWPRLTIVSAVMLPSMHIALVVAIAHLLTARPNALSEPLPAQRQIQEWLDPNTWLLTAAAEFGLLLLALCVTPRAKPEARRPNPC